MDLEDGTTIDNLLTALNHELRRAVLRSLIEADTQMSPKELAAYHRVSLEVMSYHIQKLAAVEGVKLVELVTTKGTVQHFYVPGRACGRPLVRDAIGVEDAA